MNTFIESLVGSNAVAFNSVQNAIQACLESLGSRQQPLPVVLPVVCPPDTVSAVFRSGCQPFLIDVDKDTLSFDVEALKEVVEAIPTAIAVIPHYAGVSAMTEEVAALLDGHVIIRDVRSAPVAGLALDDRYTFEVYDYTAEVGAGAVVTTKHQALSTMLMRVRSGILGLAADFPAIQSSQLEGLIESSYNRDLVDYEAYLTRVRDALPSSCTLIAPKKEWGPLLFRVPNAKRAIANLHDVGILAQLVVAPLSDFDELKRRYKEPPSYPTADSLKNEIICISPSVSDLDALKEALT